MDLCVETVKTDYRSALVKLEAALDEDTWRWLQHLRDGRLASAEAGFRERGAVVEPAEDATIQDRDGPQQGQE